MGMWPLFSSLPVSSWHSFFRYWSGGLSSGRFGLRGVFSQRRVQVGAAFRQASGGQAGRVSVHPAVPEVFVPGTAFGDLGRARATAQEDDHCFVQRDVLLDLEFEDRLGLVQGMADFLAALQV